MLKLFKLTPPNLLFQSRSIARKVPADKQILCQQFSIFITSGTINNYAKQCAIAPNLMLRFKNKDIFSSTLPQVSLLVCHPE